MAIIRGGHTVISASSSDADEQQDEGEQFSLDGQASYDPDPLVDGAMTYTWACTKIGVPEMQLYTTQNSHCHQQCQSCNWSSAPCTIALPATPLNVCLICDTSMLTNAHTHTHAHTGTSSCDLRVEHFHPPAAAGVGAVCWPCEPGCHLLSQLAVQKFGFPEFLFKSPSSWCHGQATELIG